jgi:DNA polymerase I-like protein with 3'-5' exonuclease and polymerase domains
MIDTSTLPLLNLSTLQLPMNVVLVQDAEGLTKVQAFLESTKGGVIGIDTETNLSKDFYFRKVRTIQVGNKEQQFVIDLLAFSGTEENLCETQGYFKCHEVYKPIFDVLTPALCSKNWLKCGQNLSFEYTVFFWNFGQRTWHLYSTDLAERVIQAGAISLKKMAEFSMASIVARRFGVQVDKTEQGTFDLKSPLTRAQIDYAAFDVRMPLSIREHQLREMTKDQLLSTAQIENDALGAYTDMHLNGMRIDSERWMKRIDAVFERRKEELKTLDESFIPVVGRKDSQIDFWEMAQREYAWREHFEKATPEEMAKAEAVRYTRDAGQKAVLKAELEALTKARKAKKAEAKRAFSELSKAHTEYKNKLPKMEGEAYINYGSNDQLLEALKKFKGMSTLASVGDDHLLKYNDRPMVQVLRRYRKGKKDTGTYGKQWTMQWVTKACKEEGWRHPWDGRIHANFNQLEAETGRSSSSQPNMQNLTNDEEGEVHACFICDPPDESISVSDCCGELAEYAGNDYDTDGKITGKIWGKCEKCGQIGLTHAEEYCLVTTDMSGCELRIIAELAHAGSWIKAFALGQDVHSVSTEILEPIKWKEGAEPGCAYYELDTDGNPRKQKCECKEHKKLRKHTKAINFLLAYGGGPDALADELGISVDTAKELMRQHEKAFPEVWDYLRESGERAQRMNEARDLYGRRRLLPAPTWESAREYYIDEHSDRLELEEETCDQNIFNFKAAHMRDPDEEEKRKLTHRAPTDNEIKSAMRGLWGSIGRRGKNHCIQGSNASIIKRAMGCGFDKDGKPYLWHTLPKYKARLLSMIHDELLCQCPKRYGQQVAELVADAFRRAAAEVMSQVQMEAEWNISDHWQK